MVWLVIGHRTRSERVPEGLVIERRCGSCGERATFHERRAIRTFRLYFLDAFDYDTQRVMACGACGTLFATDEHGAPSEETREGWRKALSSLSSAAGSVGSAVSKASDAIAPVLERAGVNAREVFEDASEGIAPLAKKAGEGVAPLARRASEGIEGALRRLRVELGESDDEEEPDEELPESAREKDPEKAAVLRRFEALEKKLRAAKDDE